MPTHRWNWVAVGKHPAAKDYIRFGGVSPLLDAVARWSAKGYQQLHGGKDRQSKFYSWRFWLKGVKKGTLVCGLGRDSSDSIGRPYPLLIMGEGLLKGWENDWTLLPKRLENSWNRMEFVAAHRYDSAAAMEEKIRQFTSPANDTVGLGELPKEASSDSCGIDLTQCSRQIDQDGFGMIHFKAAYGVDPGLLAQGVHARLRECCQEIPRGVFIGGTLQQTFLAVVQHPLVQQDFVRLWTC
jgi:type VI secretion system ImpM family protein